MVTTPKARQRHEKKWFLEEIKTSSLAFSPAGALSEHQPGFSGFGPLETSDFFVFPRLEDRG